MHTKKNYICFVHRQTFGSGVADTLGEWTSTTLQYTAGNILLEVTFKTYSNVPVVMFEQVSAHYTLSVKIYILVTWGMVNLWCQISHTSVIGLLQFPVSITHRL